MAAKAGSWVQSSLRRKQQIQASCVLVYADIGLLHLRRTLQLAKVVR